MTRISIAILLLVNIALVLSGCGSGTGFSGSPDAVIAEPVVNFAESIKVQVAEIQAALQQEGPPAAQAGVEAFLENTQTLDEKQVGEHKATYEQLVAKAKELKALFDQKAGADQIQPKIQELVDLSNKLPGKPAPPESVQQSPST